MDEKLGLDYLPREQLIERARTSGVRRPELLTREELEREILRLTAPSTQERGEHGWFSAARGLLANVVDGRLHLTDAARFIRGTDARGFARAGPPVATLTLAEIYASQGHTDRALQMLDRIVREEPEHERARALRDRLIGQRAVEDPGRHGTTRSGSTGVSHASLLREDIRAIDTVAESVAETPPPEPEGPEPEGPEPEALELEPREDAAVFSRPSAGEVRIYWEISTRSRQAAGRQDPRAECIVRLLVARANWEGVEMETIDRAVQGKAGWCTVSVPHDPSVVRASLGWKVGERFVPLAVASELKPDARSSAEAALLWAPAWRHSHEPSDAELRALAAFESAVPRGPGGA